ncbi:epidermal retinol dehydrogenase 2-like isoform X2 [Portunus trituberculatus]|uniref:epidermal retinol dehydrogenase 2-like isoform X2 n=1 Tax=Portunus trituberculatus TaxID=210409 RepID=UPI001E1CD701|nr:epidermal retinol dehydrogenase 2-like isoform X2 [Portunus trituberculatus]
MSAVDILEMVAMLGMAILALISSIFYGLYSLLYSMVPKKFRVKDIKGQVVLVTGGGSGIGRLLCLKLARKGARVVTWDVNKAGNEETMSQVTAAGGQCYIYTVDLCDRHAVYAAAAKVKQEVGKVDILINNAGIVTGKNFLEAPDELVQKTFDVNILSHFWTTKAFLGDMMASNKGHVVTIASVAGLAGVNKLADYCASKFAAVGFDESLRLELKVGGYTGVKTTAICPYYINTGMFEGVKSKLIPILSPEYVSDEIVDAILLDYYDLVLPRFCRYLILLKYFLPNRLLMVFGEMSGITCSMNDFVGRKKDN